MLSLSEAARVSGQSKSTIWRAVNSGRLSVTRTYTGDYEIDPAELHRVFSSETSRQTRHPRVGETGRFGEARRYGVGTG